MEKASYPRIVYLASHNRHKAQEIQAIVQDHFQIRGLHDFEKDINWTETGETFEENALIKALAVKPHTKHCVVGEDSGLVVPALNGEPGIYSARYAGVNSTDQENREKLLSTLKSFSDDKRKAYFICTIAFIDENQQQSFYTGTLHGTIHNASIGDFGFGYDPIFIPKDSQKTLAQMTPEEKNSISHRKKALEQWLLHNS